MKTGVLCVFLCLLIIGSVAADSQNSRRQKRGIKITFGKPAPPVKPIKLVIVDPNFFKNLLMAKKQALGKIGMAVMGLFAKLGMKKQGKMMPAAGGPMQAAMPPAPRPPLPAAAPNPWTPSMLPGHQPPLPAAALNPWTPAMMQGWNPNYPLTISMPPVTMSMPPMLPSPVPVNDMPAVIATAETEYRRSNQPIRLYLSGYAHRIQPSTNNIETTDSVYNIAITPRGRDGGLIPVYHDGPRTNPRQQPYEPNYLAFTTRAPPQTPREYDDYPEYSTQSPPSRVARTVPPTKAPEPTQQTKTTRKSSRPKRPTTTTTEEPEQEEEEMEEEDDDRTDEEERRRYRATTTKPNPRIDNRDNEVYV